MASKHRGEGKVQLGGKTYVLRLTFQAVDEIEEMTGLGIFDLARGFVQGGVRARHVAAIIHACARAANNEGPGVDEISAVMIADGANGYLDPVGLFLLDALAGGRTPKKTAAAGTPTGSR